MVRVSVSHRLWARLSRWLTNLRRTTSRLVVMALCSRCPTRRGLLRNSWRWSFPCCRSVGSFASSTKGRRYERFYVMAIESWAPPRTSSWLRCCTPGQHLSDHPSPLVGHDGFQEKGINIKGPKLLRGNGVAETGAENDGDVRSDLA